MDDLMFALQEGKPGADHSQIWSGARMSNSSWEAYDAESAANAALGLRPNWKDGELGGHDPLVVEGRQAGLAAEVLLRSHVVHRSLQDRLELHNHPGNQKDPC